MVIQLEIKFIVSIVIKSNIYIKKKTFFILFFVSVLSFRVVTRLCGVDLVSDGSNLGS